MLGEQSGFIDQQKRLSEGEPTQSQQALEKALAMCANLADDKLPPIEYMNIVGSHNRSHFRKSQSDLFRELVIRSRINPSSTVVDLGCGCGRLAIPFAFFLDNGRYYGVDVWREGIEWCKGHLSVRNSCLEFFMLEPDNPYYFEERQANIQNVLRMEFVKDSSVDFAFAISVFTHLVSGDCRQYFSELSRILKRSGIAYLTCFIIDRFFFRHVSKTGLHRAVREHDVGCYYAYRAQDFFAGYTQEKWQGMLEESGLEILSFELGSWANKPGSRLYQDTYIVAPKSI